MEVGFLNRLIRSVRTPDQIWCCDRCRDSSLGAQPAAELFEAPAPAGRSSAYDPEHERLLLRVKLET